jgi:hypothetical protein
MIYKLFQMHRMNRTAQFKQQVSCDVIICKETGIPSMHSVRKYVCKNQYKLWNCSCVHRILSLQICAACQNTVTTETTA